MLPGQGIERIASGSAASAGHPADLSWPSPADLSWPKGIGQRELARDLAWLTFFVGALGLNPPFETVRPETAVWFPADLAALIGFWLWPGPFLALIRRNALLLSWPLLAIASTIWSVTPGISLYHGLQLLMTVLVGVLLSLHVNLFRVVQLFFVASVIGAVLCLMFVFVSPGTAIAPGGEWTGLFRHKNLLGMAMAILIITGACLFLQGWRPGFTAAATALGAGMLMMSRSGTALASLALALMLLLPVFLYRRGHTVLVFSVGLLLSALAAGLMYIEVAGIDIVEYVLDSLGKDATLTGRTLIWDFGVAAFEERPWLGFGYHAWWSTDETAAETLRMITGFPFFIFHNSFLEVAVAFGVLGPIAVGAVILFVLTASVRAFLADPQYIRAWPLLYLLLILIQATAENPLFNNHGLVEVLLVAIGSAGMQQRVRIGDHAALSDEAGSHAVSGAGGAIRRWR
jgi:exopolysaccharide production protein ExoQ